MRSINTLLGAFAKLCLSCVYRAESLLAEDVQDGRCPELRPHRHVRNPAAREGLLSGDVVGTMVPIVTALLQSLGLMFIT